MSLFPTTAESAGFTTVTDVVSWVGLQPAVVSAIHALTGDLGTRTHNWALLAPEVIRAAVTQATVTVPAVGTAGAAGHVPASQRNLSPLEAAQVGMVWRIARRLAVGWEGYTDVDPLVAIAAGTQAPQGAAGEGAHVHDDTVSSVSWSCPGLELNVNKLEEWIDSLKQNLGTELFRYEGVLAVKGCEEKFIFQGVHMQFHGGFASDVFGPTGNSRKRFKAEDGQGRWSPSEQRECRFGFTGKNIKQKHGEQLRAELLQCAAEENLRFKVGDVVEAKSSAGWVPALVLKVWDVGNPYRLEVQGDARTNTTWQMWAPQDDSRFIRAFGEN